jgi:FkbM family methyltransferase
MHYKFRCEAEREFTRCLKLFKKEPGTCEWIESHVSSGDIFYDIGANIGVYSILAARRMGRGGKVYAFEPHSANFTRLLENIAVNNLENIVIPCNFALHEKEGFFPFEYTSSGAGTSDSQLSSEKADRGNEDRSEMYEFKYATSIDRLIASEILPAPHHIKIDVDGNEHLILHGMNNLLRSSDRPRSVQIEMHKQSNAEILSFMENHKYVLSHKHYTRAGRKRIAEGIDTEDHPYNAIFLSSG